MTLAGWIMIVFWIGFLLFGIVSWALNKTFRQIQDIEMDLDEEDIRNIM